MRQVQNNEHFARTHTREWQEYFIQPSIFWRTTRDLPIQWAIVCLCPGGDDGAAVKGNFAYAASKNADIIITACRTRGESINEVYEQEKNLNIRVEWFRKSYEYHLCQDTLELCNQEFARVMFDALSK